MADITVTIDDQTNIVSQEGFGLPLVVCTTAQKDYTKYDVNKDFDAGIPGFAEDTEVSKIINTMIDQIPKPRYIAVFGVDLSASEQKATDLVTALNDLIKEHGDWYRLILDDKTEALITAASDWAENNDKSFYALLNTTTVTTDFSNKEKTNLFYKANTDRLDGAAVGFASTRIPGSFIYKFKNLKSITADPLSPTELATLRDKNINTYISKFASINMATDQLDDGVAANGKDIEFIESKDWIKYRIAQEIASILMSEDKVGVDDTGIASFVTAVRTALDDATANNIIKKDASKKGMYSITYPSADDLPAADIEDGIISGIEFKYVFLYGTKQVIVSGAVAVNL